jgi:hypothetical protein
MVIETDNLLVKCPVCGGWPMAACLPKSNSWQQQEVRFRCAHCRHQEGGRLRRPGGGRRFEHPLDFAARREMR